MAEVQLGVVRGISFGLFGPPDTFVPAARDLGAGVVRIYLYWQQIEPEPGRFDWATVDSLLSQLDGAEEAWVTVCSSSSWATERATDFLPPNPARDLATYGAFVRRLVERCRGRVKYWQCDNEPSVPILWAGSVQEYLAQLAAFAAAVRAADPEALVVLGGMPPTDPDGVFERLVADGRDDFDIFDVHLYGEPYEIPATVERCREMMAAHGYQKPIVAGEYNGPVPFQLPAVSTHLAEVMRAVGPMDGGIGADWTSATSELNQQTPEHDAMVALYARMADLPPSVQMFMDDCPADAELMRHRWNCRDIVVRNLLALASGIRLTLCWNLGPEVPGARLPYRVMSFMFAKFALLDYDGDRLTHRYPAGDALALTSRMVRGASEVTRRTIPGRPELYVFDVHGSGGPVVVAWERRDDLTGEDLPPTVVDWEWPHAAAVAVDAYGEQVPTRVADGRVRLGVGLAPVFLTVPDDE